MNVTSPPIVSLDGVSKRFGSTQALSGVSLELHGGEVHVLLGENGAGKSTLVKTILGAYQPDTGNISVRGEVLTQHSPAQARRLGINVVMQDFSLAPTMSVLDNLFLGREPGRAGFVAVRQASAEAERVRALVNGDFSLDIEVGSLPRSEQQLVEIMKAVMGEPGLLVLDEPTASLSEQEAERLFGIVERLTADDWAVLYITHRMAEIRRLGHRVTVLRDGAFIASHQVAEVSDDLLLREMVGREVSRIYPPKAAPEDLGEIALELERVSSLNGKVREVSLDVRAGEIVAVAGLVGAGKGDIVRLLAGHTRMSAGEVRVGAWRTTRPIATALISQGVGYMPEDRKTESLALDLTVGDNLTLDAMSSREFSWAGFLSRSRLRDLALQMVELLNIRPIDVRTQVSVLSGGNQQKVVLGRALSRQRRVLVIAEPTAGVDVGARQQIYGELRRACEKGTGILMVSSDLEEVVGVADRVYVMNAGTIIAELAGNDITEQAVIAAAFGHAA